MINKIIQKSELSMGKSINALLDELSRLRAGRANPSLLEHIKVDYYGVPTALTQVAAISTEGARTLLVTPWEKNIIPAIEKAILLADLGLNPVTSGSIIRVPLPALTEDRRKEMLKVVKETGEKSKIAVRQIRRTVNTDLKNLLKEKEITEDDDRKAEGRVQTITDKYIQEIDNIISEKEKELMTV